MNEASQIESHLRILEERIVTLNANFMTEADDFKRAAVQRELNALQIVVEHYRAAMRVERGLNTSRSETNGA
jgi:hypothetical protein